MTELQGKVVFGLVLLLVSLLWARRFTLVFRLSPDARKVWKALRMLGPQAEFQLTAKLLIFPDQLEIALEDLEKKGLIELRVMARSPEDRIWGLPTLDREEFEEA